MVGIMPVLVADYAIGSDIDAATGPGGDFAIDISISHVHGVRQTGIGGDVAMGLVPRGGIDAVGTVRGVGGVKTVGLDVVAPKVDLSFGHHAFGKKPFLASGAAHAPA